MSTETEVVETFQPEVVDEKKTGLVPFSENKAAMIFKHEEGIKVIDQIAEKIKEDMSKRKDTIATEKGRKAMKSYKTKIVRSRTYLESIGKEEAAKIKKLGNGIDEIRRYSKKKFAELEEEFIKPLADWENKEKMRVDTLQAQVDEIEEHGKLYDELTGEPKHLSSLKISLNYLENLVIDDSWEEFKADAETKCTMAKMALKGQIKQFEELEARRAAEEEERKKKEEADRKAREEQIRKEAEEKANQEAQKRAQKQKEEAERAARKEKEEQERKLKEAEEKAKRAEEEAKRKYEAQKAQEEADRKAQEEAERKRTEDVNHRKKINNEIVESLMKFHEKTAKNLDAPVDPKSNAKQLVVAIVKGDIPHVKVVY